MLNRNKATSSRRLPLAVEIAIAITIKLLILFWLWHTFFSAPQAKKMRMPTTQVEQHLLSEAQRPVSVTQFILI